MKKFLVLLTAAVTFSLLPTVSQASCVATGQIARVFVTASGTTNIGVRIGSPGSTFYNFTTTVSSIITAALIAQASHQTVTVSGNAATCSAPAGGLSTGGAVVSLTVPYL